MTMPFSSILNAEASILSGVNPTAANPAATFRASTEVLRPFSLCLNLSASSFVQKYQTLSLLFAGVPATSISKLQKALVAAGDACHHCRMDALAWVFLCLFLFPLPFLLWFGVIPLWVNRRLKRVGIEVMGRCRNVLSLKTGIPRVLNS